ncbi:MAG: GIY-YIG nuclease family protein [Syntrophothermus sp.]
MGKVPKRWGYSLNGVTMKRELHPHVYIMTTKSNHVHYTGVTSNLLKRVAEHKDKVVPGFTASYNVTEPVHYAVQCRNLDLGKILLFLIIAIGHYYPGKSSLCRSLFFP